MTTRPSDPRLAAMLEEASRVPPGFHQAVLLEQAAGLAETLGDLDAAWTVRTRLIGTPELLTHARYVIHALAWCLTMSDRDPQRFPPNRVLWEYKWIATSAPEVTAIPRRALLDLVTDLESRYRTAGWSRRGALHKRVEVLIYLGETAALQEAVGEWRSAPRGWGADCTACEADLLVDVHLVLGEDEAAIQAGKEIVSGRLTCSNVPQSTFAKLLPALRRAGKLDLARALCRRGFAGVAGEDHLADHAPAYLSFAARDGQTSFVVSAFRPRLAQALRRPSEFHRMRMFAHLSAAAAALAESGVEELEVPKDYSSHSALASDPGTRVGTGGDGAERGGEVRRPEREPVLVQSGTPRSPRRRARSPRLFSKLALTQRCGGWPGQAQRRVAWVRLL